jgi:hypothetical protein
MIPTPGQATHGERLVRLASALVLIALLVELVSLFVAPPRSFAVFAIIGGAALGGGLLTYLYWLLFSRRHDETARGNA